MRFIFISALVAMLASPAFSASSDWAKFNTSKGTDPLSACSSITTAGTNAVGSRAAWPGSSIAHCATNGNQGDSPIFEIPRAATLTFDPDIGATGATGNATIYLQKCLWAEKSSTICERVIFDADANGVIDPSDVTESILNGDNGETVNNGRFGWDIDRGYYYIEYVTNPNAGEEAYVVIEGKE